MSFGFSERDEDANDMLDCFDSGHEPVKAEAITRDTNPDFREAQPTLS